MQSFSYICFVTALAVTAMLPSAAHARKWSDKSGRFSTEAEFVSQTDGIVVLRKPNGALIRLVLSQLSESDQAHVRSLGDAEGEAALDEDSPASGDGQTQLVLAEGAGENADEALKDALRNAVRQVVGALVDATTVVENDEIIEDKVLAYSGGFVSKYEVLPRSKTAKGGVYRIKIKAYVKRTGVISRLKAADVSVKEVDGKGLFAEVVTQLDAEENAEAILRKALTEFPMGLITATVTGKPEIVDKNADRASVRICVTVQTNPQAYKTFSESLKQKLEKISTDRSDLAAVFREERLHETEHVYFVPKDSGWLEQEVGAWMPKAFERRAGYDVPRCRTDQVTVGLVTTCSRIGDRMNGRHYVLDKKLQACLAEVGARRLSAKLSLLDEQGELVIADSFPLLHQVRNYGISFDATLVSSMGSVYGDGRNLRVLGLEDGGWNTENGPLKQAHIFLFSPAFFSQGDDDIRQKSSLKIERTITMTLEELKQLSDAKCELSLRE